MDFVVITLDSVRMKARLPPDKIQKSNNLLQRKSCKKRYRFLNFTCSVVLPGREFLRRLISLIMSIKEK